MSVQHSSPALLVALALVMGACRSKPEPDLAPLATSLEPARAGSAQALKATIQPRTSEVQLEMRAPLENIYGVAKDATTGELFIDPTHLESTSGLVQVDLEKLVLTQEKREREDADFGALKRDDLQNQHARTWLEIGDDTPEPVRQANRFVQFRITKVANVSEPDVTRLSGAEREVTAVVTGDFILHQRKVEKSAKMKVVFHYEGARLRKVRMTTVEPLVVDLEAHDVRPRKAFGVLAEATLTTLGRKVDQHPKVSLDLEAQPQDGS